MLRPSGEIDRSTAAHLIEFVSAHARCHDKKVLPDRPRQPGQVRQPGTGSARR